MTLRETLGDDVQRIYEQVDVLLDTDDGVMVLFDGSRMLSYTQGFGVSPCQLELLSVEAATAAAILPMMVGVDKSADESSERGDRLAAEERARRRGMPSQRRARACSSAS